MLRISHAYFNRTSVVKQVVLIGTVVLGQLLATGSCVAGTPNDAQADVSSDTNIGNLIAELKDNREEDGKRSALAAEKLGKMGSKAEPAIADLIVALADERTTGMQKVAEVAADALVMIGRPAVAPLTKALRNNNGNIRWRAAKALGQLGPDAEPAIGELAEALNNKIKSGDMDFEDYMLSGSAADALANIGRPAVPALTKALQNEDHNVRHSAVDAINQIGPDAASAAADLERLLKTDSDDIYLILEAYANVQTDVKEVLRLLSSFLRDRNSDIRSFAAQLLGRLGPKAAPAVSALMAGLDDRGETLSPKFDHNWAPVRPVCCDMAETLGKIGYPARAALPKLSTMMTGDKRPTVRISAALAICQIDPPNKKALRNLIRILEDSPDEIETCEASVALGELGPRARDAVPALGRTVRHKCIWIRLTSVTALGKIGGSEAFPFLVFAARDPVAKVRWEAIESLGNLSDMAIPAVPVLIHLLKTTNGPDFPDDFTVPITIEVLGAIDPPATDAIPVLEMISKSENKRQYVREVAAAALKKIRLMSPNVQRAKNDVVIPQTEEAAVIDRIERCGARVTVDRSQPGKSSTFVEFWGWWRADAGLALLNRLSHIQLLDLAWTETTDAGLAHLRTLTDLQSLDLSGTKITDAGLANLRALTKLQSLKLSKTEITDAGLAHLKGLSQIQSLELSGTHVKGPGFKNLSGMTRLRTLIFAGDLNQQNESRSKLFDDAALRHLRGLDNLQTLDLSLLSITDAGLAHIGQLKGLQSLDLSIDKYWSRHRLNDPDLRFLDDITDAGLAHLGELHALQSLNLSGRSITDAGLVRLNRLYSLKQLRLYETLVTDSGVKSIMHALPRTSIDMPTVEVWTIKTIQNLGGKVTLDEKRLGNPVIGIDLSNTRIGDEDVKMMTKLPTLETLDLSQTEVTDTALSYLKNLTGLHAVNLAYTKVTGKGIKKLQDLLPNCQIKH
jgi:internalin A